MSNQDNLYEINAETSRTLLPVIIIIGILMILGLLGNPLVIYFYGIRLKPTASYIFITALACFDLASCLISMPLEMVDLIYFVTFESPTACRTLRFVNYFASIASGGTLIAIAVDRFRKICKPFERQISNKLARIVLIIVIGFALLSSWPSAVFYDVIQVNITIKVNTVIGYDCSTIRDVSYLSYIVVYNAYLFILFVASIIVLVVLYILVGQQLYKLRSFRFYATRNRVSAASIPNSMRTIESDVHSISAAVSEERLPGVMQAWNADSRERALAPIEELEVDILTARPTSRSSLNIARRFSKFFSNKVEPQSDDKEGEDYDDDDDEDDDSDDANDSIKSKIMEIPQFPVAKPVRQTKSFTEYSKREKLHPNILKKAKSLRTILSKGTSASNVHVNRSDLRRTGTRLARCESTDIDEKKTQSQNINTKKFTVIAVSISVAFIISFLPYLVLMIWWTAYSDHEINFMSDSELVVYQLFVRSFLFNAVCNPVIYGLLNTEFKNMLLVGLKKLFSYCCNDEQEIPSEIISQSAEPTRHISRERTRFA